MFWGSVVWCLVIRGIENGTEDISYAIEMRWYVEDCIKGFCCTLMRSIWSSPSVRQMRTFLDDYITSRTFLEPWPSGIAIHAWLFASNMRQCFLILKSHGVLISILTLCLAFDAHGFVRNVSYRGSCLSTLARKSRWFRENHQSAFRLCLGALGFEVLIHKVGPLLIFDDGPRVRNRMDRTDRTPEGALAQICPFRVVSSCHLQAFVWNDRWNAWIWPWTISFDAGRTGSITGDVAWWIASIRLLPQQNDWTLDSFDRIRILLWKLFAQAARYSQTSKHPLECFAFNPHDYCDEILGTIWTSNLTVHSCWVLQLHWYSTPE